MELTWSAGLVRILFQNLGTNTAQSLDSWAETCDSWTDKRTNSCASFAETALTIVSPGGEGKTSDGLLTRSAFFLKVDLRLD